MAYVGVSRRSLLDSLLQENSRRHLYTALLDENAEIEPRPIKVAVGMTIDGTPPKRTTDPKTGDIMEVHNSNEPIFIRLRGTVPGWEFCDSLGRHVQESLIRFNVWPWRYGSYPL
ncbi:hypothetical protein FQN50_001992 [Emmonsiellopsis sp. PD_5]|nr:hypothetical protein FQN50_001992 [Emmonsiellopsis sp. PD_5]